MKWDKFENLREAEYPQDNQSEPTRHSDTVTLSPEDYEIARQAIMKLAEQKAMAERFVDSLDRLFVSGTERIERMLK